MGTMCEEGFCDCSFHKPNMKHPGGCGCVDCEREEKEKNVVTRRSSELLVVNNFDDYQRFAGVTANMDLPPELNLAVLALGCAGEAGEVADYVKKHLGHHHDLDREKLIKELGDVLWYIAVLGSSQNISLREVAQKNIEKLAARYPEGFSVERSKNRSEGDV